VCEARAVDDIAIVGVDRQANPFAETVGPLEVIDFSIEAGACDFGETTAYEHPHDALRRNWRVGLEPAEPLRRGRRSGEPER